MRLYQFLQGLAEVELPEGLETTITEERGLVNFDFDPAIELPYLEGDEGKETWRRDFEIGDLSNAVLRAALPQFFGDKDNTFYEHSCDRPTGNPNYRNTRGVPLKQYLGGQQPYGYVLSYEHKTDDGALAYLQVDVHSTNRWGDRSSGLEGGNLFGRVFPDVKIPFPKEGQIYHVDIVANILGGLLDRRRARGMLYAKGSRDRRPAVFIKDPTMERMKTALKHVKDIEEFFRDHSQRLQDVAGLYSVEKNILARMGMMVLSRKFPGDLAEMEEPHPALKPWH